MLFYTCSPDKKTTDIICTLTTIVNFSLTAYLFYTCMGIICQGCEARSLSLTDNTNAGTILRRLRYPPY